MKKINIRKMKLNNQGSTFVLALIVITLITTLAVAILAASAHNISMKNVDRNSKATFYTAESVMDEIRAGVGLDSMNQLAVAYESVLTTIVKEDASGFSYIVDNDSANAEFKSTFVDKMLSRMSDGTMMFAGGANEYYADKANTNIGKVKDYLQSFIKGYDEGMASITSLGDVQAYKDSLTGRTYMIIIKDVAVQYKEEKQGEVYFSNVTADLELQFPNMTVDFSTTNRLNDFVKFAMIADDNLIVADKEVNVQSSIYAGGKISVTSNDATGSLYLSSEHTADGGQANVICGGNTDADAGSILLQGSSSSDKQAKLNATNVNIWCTNIVTKSNYVSGSDASAGALIEIDNLCNTYVKDDLTIEGQDSEIEINGNYYGYSYDGYDVNALHANSSAIIINGRRAKLTLGTTKMILGGHAYIEIGSDYYTTGESLAFKGDQEIYLVPSAYLGKNYGSIITNPMSIDTWNALVTAAGAEDSEVEICDIDGFFAEEKGYLSATPYTVKQINNLVYLYLNFKDKDSSAKYVYDVANGTNGAPASLKNLLNKYTQSLFTNAGKVEISADSQIFTKGALLETSGGSAGTVSGTTSSELTSWIGANSNNSLSNDEFVLTSLDLSNRYEIFTHLLADIPWYDTDTGKKYIVNDVDSALWQKKNYLVSGNEFTTSSVFDVIVDKGMVESDEYNPAGAAIQLDIDGYECIKVAKKGNYVIDRDCRGIVIATGTVTVSCDNFAGIIIAGENIEFTKDTVISSLNEAQIEMLITNELGFKDSDVTEDGKFSEYFYAYKHAATDDDSREEVKVETVDYKDLVNFNNWRKYED